MALGRNYTDLRFCPQDDREDLDTSRTRSLGRLKAAFHGKVLQPGGSLPFHREILLPSGCSSLAGSAYFFAEEENLSAAINMDEHLLIQSQGKLEDVPTLLDLIRGAEAAVRDEKHPFAFDGQLGFLSYRPALAGSGLRMNLVMHLPLLSFLKQIRGFTESLRGQGIRLSPLNDGVGRNPSKLFLLGNLDAPLHGEEETIRKVRDAADLLQQKEGGLQQKALFGNGQSSTFLDQVWRSYGILRYARRLSPSDFLNHWSNLRLGALHQVLPITLEATDSLLDFANDSAFKKEGADAKTFLFRRADSVRRALSGG